MKPLVSVVIATRNRYEYLKRCVASILNQTYSPIEIIIVDDCSTDETPKIQEINNIIYIRNNSHKGAVESCAIGRNRASSDYIAQTDDDCIVEENWIEMLMETMKKSDAWLVGSRIINVSKDMLPQKVSKLKKSKLGKLLWKIFYLQDGSVGKVHINGVVEGNFDKKEEGYVDWITGGSMLYNRKKYNMKLDVNMFYFVEVDGCLKAKNEGLKCYFTSKTTVYHDISKHARPSPTQMLRNRYKYQIYFLLKNKFFKKSILSFIATTYTQVFDTLFFLILSLFQPHYFNAIWGKYEGIKLYKKLKKESVIN